MAGSSVSARLVAMITFTFVVWSKPSIWFSSSSKMRCTSRSAPVCASNRLVAMASTSSMNTIAGEFSRARRNTSRTIRGPWKRNTTTMRCVTTEAWPTTLAAPTHLAKVLLHKLRADHADERGSGSVGDCLGQHGLASTRWAKHEHLQIRNM